MAAVYKYVADVDAVPFLLKGVVKFTPIGELNDPSELVPNVLKNAVVASLARLRENGYTDEDMVALRRQGSLFGRLAPHHQVIAVPDSKENATAIIRSSFYDKTDLLVQRLDATVREMSSKVGLFCLSRRYDSLPMWAHYAAGAKGLVVEFSGLESVFRGDDSGVLFRLVDVTYDRALAGVTFDPRSHESLFFSKFEDWSYEQEVRVVLPLSACRRQVLKQRELYTYEIGANTVGRLILGWNMLPSTVTAIASSVQTEYPDVEVVRAGLDRGRVVLTGC